MQARGEPRKISPSHNAAIEQAGKTICFFAQGNPGLHQQPTMSGHAGREPAIMRERRRGRARGGESAGLVHSAKFSWITLDPASHQGSVVIDIHSNMDTRLFVPPSTSRREGR